MEYTELAQRVVTTRQEYDAAWEEYEKSDEADRQATGMALQADIDTAFDSLGAATEPETVLKASKGVIENVSALESFQGGVGPVALRCNALREAYRDAMDTLLSEMWIDAQH